MRSGPHRLAASNRSLVRKLSRQKTLCGKRGHSWLLDKGEAKDARMQRPHKVCTRCRKVKPLTNFEAARRALFGV